MANPIFRRRLIARIHSATSESAAIEEIDHNGVRGTVREIFVRQLLEPVLPHRVRIGTGTVADAFGSQSGQVDLVIYDASMLAPILWDATNGVFPVEASAAIVEVKSRLTATTLAGR